MFMEELQLILKEGQQLGAKLFHIARDFYVEIASEKEEGERKVHGLSLLETFLWRRRDDDQQSAMAATVEEWFVLER